jgi:hypothetical protein
MPVAPAETPSPPDPNAAIKAETERVKAQTELDKARAERVKAFGLPVFEGKSVLDQNAGAIEALILATDAIEGAAARIKGAALAVEHPPGRKYDGRFLVVAGDETLDFGPAASIRAEIEAFEAIFGAAGPTEARQAESISSAGLASPLPVFAALAGLLRTDTEIAAVDHSAAISPRLLATAVAGKLGARAVLPGAAAAGAAESPLVDRLMALARRRDAVMGAATALPSALGEPLKAAVLRFDTFFAGLMAPDAAGRIPLIQAARLEALFADAPLVLRIYVEKAGGSLIKRANIWTLFGADPVRVSGGLVASFLITNPADGAVIAAEVLNCRTAIGKLKDIQSGGTTGVR